MADEQDGDTVEVDRTTGIPAQRRIPPGPAKTALRRRVGDMLEALAPLLIAIFVVALLVGSVVMAL